MSILTRHHPASQSKRWTAPTLHSFLWRWIRTASSHTELTDQWHLVWVLATYQKCWNSLVMRTVSSWEPMKMQPHSTSSSTTKDKRRRLSSLWTWLRWIRSTSASQRPTIPQRSPWIASTSQSFVVSCTSSVRQWLLRPLPPMLSFRSMVKSALVLSRSRPKKVKKLPRTKSVWALLWDISICSTRPLLWPTMWSWCWLLRLH